MTDTQGMMKPRQPLSGRSAWAAVAVIGACAALAPPALAMRSDAGALSSRLSELATPSLRSAPPVRQARALSLAPEGPGSLQRRGNRLIAEVRFAAGAASHLDALRAAGAEIVDLSRRDQTVTVAATPASLPALARVAEVKGVVESLAPIVYGASGGPVASASGPECEGGSVISEGVKQLQAGEARKEFGVDGGGVTVGVLSDSFDQDPTAPTHAATDVESLDLPGPANSCPGQQTPVNVLEDLSPKEEGEATDEGRAMLQIVHDVAPGASLAFATAFDGEAAFAKNIEKLAAPIEEGGAGAKVIVDDVAYFGEPFFQDGPVAAAVDKVTGEGVDYFSAAGNDNLIDVAGHEIGSWEAPKFRDSGSCPAAIAAIAELGARHCMDFDPGTGVDNTFGITVEAGATLSVDLQWAEPRHGVGTDLDALLLDERGDPLEVEGKPVGSIEDNVHVSQEPFEFFQWENTSPTARTVQLAINRFSGGNPRLKFALMENGGGVSETEYPTSTGGDEVGPTIYGHAGAASAIAVGAVPFDNIAQPERYSSRGPVSHYFGPVLGPAPAAELPAPQTISKPDLAATDCGATTFFFPSEPGAPPPYRFCGTSAAAPHAAGVAALMRQAEPAATPGEVRSALLASAALIGKFGPCAIGAGLVEAVGATGMVKEDAPVPVAQAPTCEPPDSSSRVDSGAVPVAATATPQTPASVPRAAPPRTSIASHPHRVLRTARRSALASFSFRSDQGGTFICTIDRSSPTACAETLVRRFRFGPHVLRVAARNDEGEVDPTPAVFHFRVKRVG